jgi:predicted DNA-binding transcriptional regulator AlpA
MSNILVTFVNMKISDKIILFLGHNRNYTKKDIAKMLNMSRPTFYQRLDDNAWTAKEIDILKNNGIV